METEDCSPANQRFSEIQNEWIEIQDSLKERFITEDDFNWKLLPMQDQDCEGKESQDSYSSEVLKYVGGVDLSFSKNDSSIACATLVVLDLRTLEVLHEDSTIVNLHIPYVPGFLAFRESSQSGQTKLPSGVAEFSPLQENAPALLQLLEKMKKKMLPSFPQLLMVDGNGLLHPRGFGLACHLGVLANLPTIGIGKNLHHVDGLVQSKVRQMLEAENSCKDIFTLIGASGCTLGAAMRSTEGCLKPIFISVGHRVSLATAIKIVKSTCRFRIPEPIRQADIRSKDYLRKHGLS